MFWRRVGSGGRIAQGKGRQNQVERGRTKQNAPKQTRTNLFFGTGTACSRRGGGDCGFSGTSCMWTSLRPRRPHSEGKELAVPVPGGGTRQNKAERTRTNLLFGVGTACSLRSGGGCGFSKPLCIWTLLRPGRPHSGDGLAVRQRRVVTVGHAPGRYGNPQAGRLRCGGLRPILRLRGGGGMGEGGRSKHGL
jgi:hypothetical protein